MPTVLSVTLAACAQHLAKHKASFTRITVEELAGVTILCSDKTGTLTTNKLAIDKTLIKTYSSFSPTDASRVGKQDAIDTCVVGSPRPVPVSNSSTPSPSTLRTSAPRSLTAKSCQGITGKNSAPAIRPPNRRMHSRRTHTVISTPRLSTREQVVTLY